MCPCASYLLVVVDYFEEAIQEDRGFGHVQLEAQHLEHHQPHADHLVEGVRVIGQSHELLDLKKGETQLIMGNNIPVNMPYHARIDSEMKRYSPK